MMDSNICSANTDKFRAALQTNVNWLSGASVIKPGDHTFEYKVSVPHKTSIWNGMQGYVDFYITSDSRENQMDKNLSWNDLETKPFCSWLSMVENRDAIENQGVNGNVQLIPCNIPASKSGLHTIFTIWQRADTAETFYSCSDVLIDQNAPEIQTSTQTTSSAWWVPTEKSTETTKISTTSTSTTFTTTADSENPNCSSGHELWISGKTYNGGDYVQNSNCECFICTPWPTSGYCSFYEPGVHFLWQTAWNPATC